MGIWVGRRLWEVDMPDQPVGGCIDGWVGLGALLGRLGSG